MREKQGQEQEGAEGTEEKRGGKDTLQNSPYSEGWGRTGVREGGVQAAWGFSPECHLWAGQPSSESREVSIRQRGEDGRGRKALATVSHPSFLQLGQMALINRRADPLQFILRGQYYPEPKADRQ